MREALNAVRGKSSTRTTASRSVAGSGSVPTGEESDVDPQPSNSLQSETTINTPGESTEDDYVISLDD